MWLWLGFAGNKLLIGLLSLSHVFMRLTFAIPFIYHMAMSFSILYFVPLSVRSGPVFWSDDHSRRYYNTSR